MAVGQVRAGVLRIQQVPTIISDRNCARPGYAGNVLL